MKVTVTDEQTEPQPVVEPDPQPDKPEPDEPDEDEEDTA